MASERYNTWNPQLSFRVLRGGIPGEELRRRTEKLVYIDRARGLDEIEWTLDNADGRLTRPEVLALGLSVEVSIGYLGDMSQGVPFVIHSMDGGVGVYGQNDPPVGESERRIQFRGRRRNARLSRRRHKRYQGRNRPRLGEPATMEEAASWKNEMLLVPPAGPTSFPNAKTTSAAIRTLAYHAGFTDDLLLIEDTKDELENGGRLQEGQSYYEYCALQAERFGFHFTLTERGLHFHSPRWGPASNKGVRETLEYSADRDSLQLKIAGDFKLPVPSKVKAVGYDPMGWWLTTGSARLASETGQAKNMAGFYVLRATMPGKQERSANLLREETIITAPTAASARAAARLTRRLERAVRLEITVVGNPNIMARDLVRIKRTGNPIVDGIWFAHEVRHLFEGLTYKTTINGRMPPSGIVASDLLWLTAGNSRAASEGHKGRMSGYAVKGFSALKSVLER